MFWEVQLIQRLLNAILQNMRVLVGGEGGEIFGCVCVGGKGGEGHSGDVGSLALSDNAIP